MGMDDIRGIELISEMTKEDLVSEIEIHNHKLLMATETHELKAMVIRSRVQRYQERLEKEANIEIQHGMFGAHIRDRDED